MTRLYLVRHAEAQGNLLQYFHGITDADITRNGMRQLEQLKERFKNLKIDSIYSSPLIRAYKTAQAANYYHGLSIKIDNDLVEINGGHWEGKKWAELSELYPDENYAWEEEPWSFAPLGGETMRHVYDRIWKTITAIVRENANKSVLIVSHGCAIRNFACRAKGLPIEKLNEIEWFENTSVSTFEFDESMNINILRLNDASHLDESTSTLPKQEWWQKQSGGGQQNANTWS